MPKHKTKKSSCRNVEQTSTPSDSVANCRTIEHNESTVLLRPGTSHSATDIRATSTSAARHSSISSTASASTWKLKYQDFMPRPLDSHSADSWKTVESFQ